MSNLSVFKCGISAISLVALPLALIADDEVLPISGNVWKNNTTYTSDRKTYDISPADRMPVDCPATHVMGHNLPRRIAFHLKGVSNTTLDFGGATVLLHGKMQPFLLENCTNVVVRNVSVRYARTPYTQGTVISRSDRELRVKFGEDFPVSIENGELYFIGDGWKDGPIKWRPCFMQFFDPQSRCGKCCFTAFFAGKIAVKDMDPKAPWAPSAPQFRARVDGDAVVLTSDRPLDSAIRANDIFVIGHAKRDHSNFEMADCRGVTVRNYRIVNGLGMGIFPFHCHDVTLDGVKMFHDEKTSPSIIANSADGIHAFACSGNFIVTNCVVESTIDDALNVHGNYYILEKATEREIIAFTGLEPEGSTAIFRAGDRIAVCRGHTLDCAAEYTILSTRVIDQKHVAFTVDRQVAAHNPKDIIENLSAQCRLLISDSRFGKSNTHLRLQTRGGVVIENSTTELPFILTGDMNYWYESSPCDSVTVRNCRFVGARAVLRSCPEFNPTKDHPWYHGDILVENCTFDNENAILGGSSKRIMAVNCRTAKGKNVKVTAEGCHTVVNLRDLEDDRVESPLRVNLKPIGTLRPRSLREVKGQNWRLGCEVLDRDYANFEDYRAFVAPLGIRLIRLQGGWAKCEKEKGKYDFAWLDRIVDALRADGLECAIETSYGNPIYPGGGTRDLAAGFPTSDEALKAWDAWVEALARHFQGRVNHFLMWNEPDITSTDGSPKKTPGQIAAFNVRTAKIIRDVIPSARIAGLSLAHCESKPFEDCLKAMGDDVRLFDEFIYHGYKPAPEMSYGEVEKLKQVLAKYHPSAKLWQGENGCPSEMARRFALSNIAWSEYSQAKWDMRRMLGDLGHDVVSSVFTICDFSHTGREINLKGLLRANDDREVIAIKRAYYAVQNVVSVFDDSWQRVRDSSYNLGFGSTDASLSTYHYVNKNGDPLFVFWTHSRDLNNSKLHYERPGDSFDTRPATFRYTNGSALDDPVWVDLFTGRIYAFPKEYQLKSRNSIRFINVPVYDSPCILTGRKALHQR